MILPLMLEYPWELKGKGEYDSKGKLRLKAGATKEEKELLIKHMGLFKGTKKPQIKKEKFEDIIDL